MELFDELLLLVIDERDKRGDDVSMGDERCLIGVDCFDCVGRAGV